MPRRAERVWQQQEQERHRFQLRQRNPPGSSTVIPLSYIDDINAVVPFRVSTEWWYESLDCAGEDMRLRWDKEKDWEGKKGKHLGVYLGDERRHWKERLKQARALWEQVRRLTRLPPKAKKMIVCGQLLPVLCYGCEAFTKPSEEMVRLSRQWARWVVGAWAGSSVERVEILSGVEDLAEVFRKRKIRWAASVYSRYLPELKEVAQGILLPFSKHKIYNGTR